MATRKSLKKADKQPPKKRFYGDPGLEAHGDSDAETEDTEYGSDSSLSYDSAEEIAYLSGEDWLQDRYVIFHAYAIWRYCANNSNGDNRNPSTETTAHSYNVFDPKT